MMRISVAVRTLIERTSNVLRLAVGAVGVALGTLHLSVQTGERIASLRVVELTNTDRLPVDEVVALLAGSSKPAFVCIFMARGTSRHKAEIGAAQISGLDGRSLLRRDVRRIMALAAFQPCMLPFQRVPGVFVIEGFRIPLDEREVFAIVLGVAASTLLARTGRDIVCRMQTSSRRNSYRDLGVTVQALQSRLSAAKFVTTDAVRRSIERLMRP